MTIDELLHQARTSPLSSDSRCLLCGRRPQYRGTFLPYDSVPYGGVRTKQRALIYHLCKRCYRRPARNVCVEERLLAQVQARWN
jgi:hypothetical protein